MQFIQSRKEAAAAAASNMAALAASAGSARIVSVARLDELREVRPALTGQIRDISNQLNTIAGRAKAAGREYTDAEKQRVESLLRHGEQLKAELDAVSAEIQVAEQEEIEAFALTPQPRLTQPSAIAGTVPGAVRRVTPIGKPSAKFDDVFAGRQIADPYAGRFGTLGEFALAVANAGVNGLDPRLISNASMYEGQGGATGGFLVPPGFLGPILDAALDLEVIRPRADVVPMAGPQGYAPVFDYSDRTSGKRAGLQMVWTAEGGQFSEQQGKVRNVLMTAHKAGILCRVSSELEADVPMFDAKLSQAMVNAVAAGLDIAFLQGTGSGQPLGIVNAGNTITVSKEGSQAAGTLLLQNVAKMVARLAPASFARAVWLIHPTVVVPLYTMSVVIQNVAGSENVGGSTAGAAVKVDANGNISIYGRPCVVTDACAPLGTAGDIVLADLSKYLVGVRKDATIKRADQTYLATDEIGFLLTLRIDGQPADAVATKLRDGTNTVSPFVILQAR